MSLQKEIELQEILKKSKEFQDKYLAETTRKRNAMIEKMKTSFIDFFNKIGFKTSSSMTVWKAVYNNIAIDVEIPDRSQAILGSVGFINIKSQGRSIGSTFHHVLFVFDSKDFGEEDVAAGSYIGDNSLDSQIKRETKTMEHFRNRVEKIENVNLKLVVKDTKDNTKEKFQSNDFNEVLEKLFN